MRSLAKKNHLISAINLAVKTKEYLGTSTFRFSMQPSFSLRRSRSWTSLLLLTSHLSSCATNNLFAFHTRLIE